MPYAQLHSQQSTDHKAVHLAKVDGHPPFYLYLPQCRRVLSSECSCTIIQIHLYNTFAACISYFSFTVSRHILGGVIQPHDAHICPKAHSLLYTHIQHEDVSCTPRLGMCIFHRFFCTCTCTFNVQNENINRPCTSKRKVHDLRRPDRRTAMKVLVEKSFNFVDTLWASYMARNQVDLQ